MEVVFGDSSNGDLMWFTMYTYMSHMRSYKVWQQNNQKKHIPKKWGWFFCSPIFWLHSRLRHLSDLTFKKKNIRKCYQHLPRGTLTDGDLTPFRHHLAPKLEGPGSLSSLSFPAKLWPDEIYSLIGPNEVTTWSWNPGIQKKNMNLSILPTYPWKIPNRPFTHSFCFWNFFPISPY